MSYPLSASQSEVLRLANITGDEVNVLSFSALFPYHGDSDLLVRAASIICQHIPDLNTVIINHQNVRQSTADLQVVQPFCHFSSKTEYDTWAECLASIALCAEKQCAEIYPISISNEYEGFFIRLHHVVADGWAAFILLRCLRDQYTAMLAGKSADLAEIYPYQMFVNAESSYLAGPRNRRDAAFWKEFLSGQQDGYLLSDRMMGDFSARRMSETLDDQMVRELRSVCDAKGRNLQSDMLPL